MHARALPSVPGHVPIWANFVVYGPILKISNAMCILYFNFLNLISDFESDF